MCSFGSVCCANMGIRVQNFRANVKAGMAAQDFNQCSGGRGKDSEDSVAFNLVNREAWWPISKKQKKLIETDINLWLPQAQVWMSTSIYTGPYAHSCMHTYECIHACARTQMFGQLVSIILLFLIQGPVWTKGNQDLNLKNFLVYAHRAC